MLSVRANQHNVPKYCRSEKLSRKVEFAKKISIVTGTNK